MLRSLFTSSRLDDMSTNYNLDMQIKSAENFLGIEHAHHTEGTEQITHLEEPELDKHEGDKGAPKLLKSRPKKSGASIWMSTQSIDTANALAKEFNIQPTSIINLALQTFIPTLNGELAVSFPGLMYEVSMLEATMLRLQAQMDELTELSQVVVTCAYESEGLE